MSRLRHVQALEDDAVAIMREVAAQFERPVLLFSGGKDSVVLLRPAERAFHPAALPFPVMHVDTGHNFPEVLEFRDRLLAELGAELIVASVPAAIAAGRLEDDPSGLRNRLQSPVLLAAIRECGFDAAFGGGRRDEERARAKERVLSVRERDGGWKPESQRPELWRLWNGRLHAGEHVRAFPISDWTELDVWTYIAHEDLALPSIYFSHEREVFRRDGMLFAVSEHLAPCAGEERLTAAVRYRTVGDMSVTGAIESDAATLDQIVAEVAVSRLTERGATRADDRTSEAAMEDRKREGYF
jgi:sulfate adenylyltransferase subunit 2